MTTATNPFEQACQSHGFPGSTDAIVAGCLCPVTKNRHGEGVPHEDQRRFWISGDCPIHAKGIGS